MVLAGCSQETVTPHSLMASGLEKALPDDRLGRRDGSHAPTSASVWNVLQRWEGNIRLRTETVLDWTDGKERTVVEERTELDGNPRSNFSGKRLWTGTDFKQARRTRETRMVADGEGLWLSKENGPWSKVADAEPEALGTVDKLGGAWGTYIGLLGGGLTWDQVGTTTRDGEVLARLKASYRSGQGLSLFSSESWWDELMSGKRVNQVDGELLVEAETERLREGMLSLRLSDPGQPAWNLSIMTRFDLEEGGPSAVIPGDAMQSENDALKMYQRYQKYQSNQ